MTKKEREKLDREIEQAWYRLASGIQVDIMAIGRIFADCRDAVASGQTIEQAVTAAIAKYRKN